MTRRQLIFIILFNAIISLMVALMVVWAVEARRPDPEELAILSTPVQPLPVSQPTALISTNNVDVVSAPTATAVVAVTAEPDLDVGETEIYTVQTGDSLSSIANRAGVSIDTLVRINEMPNPDYVFVGQRLLIPVSADGAAPTPTEAPSNKPITQGVLISVVEGPGDLLAEAVQIVNDTESVVNLAGWVLDSDGGPSYTFGPLSLFAGSYIWLHTRGGDATSIATYWGRDGAAWSSGTRLRLRNPQGTEVSTFTIP